ncbi:MAG TPA: aldo/keto reductase, partial [Candidatus Moranbacteria bacterium]|nr:aldo/keto reductase [Candidatus Moranbacteria bacterium]
LGQGTWGMGEKKAAARQEADSLRLGIQMGMTLIDTAEMYGEGDAEAVVGQAIRQVKRDSLFITSKVYPHNAGRGRIFAACDASLRRLGIETLDLYLLHWRGRVPLSETVACMEELVAMGKVRHWGVSNFDTRDMEELWSVAGGNRCAVNQVLYHLGSRGVEYDLLPWLSRYGVPLMAYCPMAQGGKLQKRLKDDPRVLEVAGQQGISPMQVLLAFVLSHPQVIAIPKAANPAHVRENARALDIRLTEQQTSLLNQAFPAPKGKTGLDIV